MNIVLLCIPASKLEFSMKTKTRMLLGKRNRLGFLKKITHVGLNLLYDAQLNNENCLSEIKFEI